MRTVVTLSLSPSLSRILLLLLGIESAWYAIVLSSSSSASSSPLILARVVNGFFCIVNWTAEASLENDDFVRSAHTHTHRSALHLGSANECNNCFNNNKPIFSAAEERRWAGAWRAPQRSEYACLFIYLWSMQFDFFRLPFRVSSVLLLAMFCCFAGLLPSPPPPLQLQFFISFFSSIFAFSFLLHSHSRFVMWSSHSTVSTWWSTRLHGCCTLTDKTLPLYIVWFVVIIAFGRCFSYFCCAHFMASSRHSSNSSRRNALSSS